MRGTLYRFSGPAKMDESTAIAGSTISYHDPACKYVSSTCWGASKQFHSDASAMVDSVLGRDFSWRSPTAESLTRLSDALRAASGTDSRIAEEIGDLGRTIVDNTRLLFHSVSYPPSSKVEAAASRAESVDIVIPFRCNGSDDSRLRNLTIVLGALNSQSADRSSFRIFVVEQDDMPRHKSAIENRADVYIHHNYGGPFNRAAALNLGADFSSNEVLCFLDGDIMPDADFVHRCLASIHRDEVPAMLPYTDMFCLDEISTAAVIDGRILPGADVSGYLIRHPAGACLWVSRSAYLRAGRFNERFVGWGGEDREFYNRLSAQVSVVRSDDLLIHLLHDRPPMSFDSTEILRRAGL